MGKSSTVNSLLGERVANVAALQSDVARPQVIARAADGFTLTLIDTPGLLEADAVSDAVRRLQPVRCVWQLAWSTGMRSRSRIAALPGVCAEAGQRRCAVPALFTGCFSCCNMPPFLCAGLERGHVRAGAKCSMERVISKLDKRRMSNCAHDIITPT